jgi:glutamine synthetase
VRVPAKRGSGTRIELRSPDPSANPYLALAVMLKAGLDGIKKNLLPPDPVDKNMYTMSKREKARLKIGSLPGNLNEALYYMGKDKLVKAVLGSHIYDHFVGARRKEWELYIQQVHPWEIDRYLSMY